MLSFDSTSFPEEPSLVGEDVWGGPEGVRVGDPGGAGRLKPGGGPGGAHQLKPLGDPRYPRDLRYTRDPIVNPGGDGQVKHLLHSFHVQSCRPNFFCNRYSVIIYSKANIQTLRK